MLLNVNDLNGWMEQRDSSVDPDRQEGSRAGSPTESHGMDVRGLLDRVYEDAMQSLEVLSIAVRYFCEFPQAALVFATCAAGKARHAALIAASSVRIKDEVRPVQTRSGALELMPGFKADQRGELSDLVGFLAHAHSEEQRVHERYSAIAELETTSEPIRRMFKRLADDERAFVASFRDVLVWLAVEGYEEAISTKLASYGSSADTLDSCE